MCKSMIELILILLTFVLQSNCETKLWQKLINRTNSLSENYFNEFEVKFLAISESQMISESCNQSIWQTVNAFKQLDGWAVQMINSWGHFPPSGVLVGTSTDFGSYDQCLAIETNDVIDRPQYCMIDLRPPLPDPMPVHHNLNHRIDVLPEYFKSDNKTSGNVFKHYSEFASFYYWLSLRTGICTPSKCSQNDIQSLAIGFADDFGLELMKIRCESETTESRISVIQIIAIVFIFSAILIAIMATFVDSITTKKLKTKYLSFIDTFSLKENIKCLFADRSSEVFPCIHGIRVLTMVWVIFSHSTEWTNFQLFSNSFKIKDIFTRVESQLTLNGEYAVENFFFIGGMLTSFITLQYTRGQLSRFNSIAFLLARYLRLTPQLFAFTLLTFLLPLGGWASGPIWKETITPIIDNCATNWWWNVLYIQNFFTATKICALHSWFLACDMQYHWISLLLVIPVLYRSKLGTYFTLSTILGFYITSVVIGYVYDLPPGLINSGRDEYFLTYYIDLFYIRPWSHATVFFIGFLFGIIAYNRKFKKLNQISKCFMFLLIIFGYCLCLMDTYPWHRGEQHTPLISALVFSTSRLIWSISTAALIWVCISGNGGLINSVLSSRLFIPLSRLTYSVYLTHVWIIWIFVGTRRERIDTNPIEIILIFIHNLIISYFIGFLFAILFEIPVIKLQKRLMNMFLITERPEGLEISIQLNGGTGRKVDEVLECN